MAAARAEYDKWVKRGVRWMPIAPRRHAGSGGHAERRQCPPGTARGGHRQAGLGGGAGNSRSVKHRGLHGHACKGVVGDR